MIEIFPSEKRGVSRLSWLESRHTFSFGRYVDRNRMGVSHLRVINDDIILPAGGFETHPHHDMEIFTYVLTGALEHKDSMGNGSVIRPGEVQMMSAGSGVTHSEFNHSKAESLHLLQIWIIPDRTGITPRYQQVEVSDSQKRGKLCLIISPDGSAGSLQIYQDAKVYAALLNSSESLEYRPSPDRCLYLHLIRGTLSVNATALKAGDGADIREEEKLSISNGSEAEFLLFDLVK